MGLQVQSQVWVKHELTRGGFCTQVLESQCELVVSTRCGPTGAFFFSMTFVLHLAGVSSAHVCWHEVCRAILRLSFVVIPIYVLFQVIPIYVCCLD